MKILSYFVIPAVLFKSSKKTLLDLGDHFQVSTYFKNEDITVVSHGDPSKKRVIILPGIDMSGLSVYPHIMRLSEEFRTYTLISHDLKKPDISDIVKCTIDVINDDNMYDETIVIGESCGAIIALNCIRNCKKMLKKVILLNPATPFWEMKEKKSVSEKLTNPLEIMRNSPSFNDISQSIISIVSEFPLTEMYHYMVYFYMLHNQFMFPVHGNIHRINNWIGNSYNMTMDSISKFIPCDVILILGTDDGLIPQEECNDIFKGNVKNLETHWVKKGTHMLTPNLVDIRKFV